MGMTATLRRAVKKAFQALGDINKKVTYSSVTGPPVRDFDAGTFTVPTVNQTLTLVVFTKFTEKETDKDAALLTGMKMLFPTDDLKVASKASDTVVDDKGNTWEVMQRLSDPASVVTILQVRSS